VARADVAYAEWCGGLLDHTGLRDQLIADLQRLDAAMTERYRARTAAHDGTERAPQQIIVAER
jgi:hypothetical protein